MPRGRGTHARHPPPPSASNVAPVSDAPSSPEDTVLVRADGGIGHLTLNRPRAINALDHAMIAGLTRALDAWEHDPSVALVLLDGAGERGLCAGGDVRGLRQQIIAGDTAGTVAFFRAEYGLNARIAGYPKPVVAIADGVTMGGGIGLAGHAPVRVVTERSRLAMPETRIGFTPDVGGSWLLAHAPGRTGEYLALTGGTMDAADALYAGFADVLVPGDRLAQLGPALLDAAEALLTESGSAADPASARSRARAAIAGLAVSPGPSALAAARPWIDDAFSADTVAGIIARLRARPEPEASAAADTLEDLAPTALTVTLAAVRTARTLPDLRAALAQEYGLVLWFAATQPDLVEGIRAQLVDKDRDPHWQPATLDAVAPGLAAEALAWTPPVPLWN